jgi:S-adenosylmethionine-diacylglycerol 3-amino-3-carboxypropyl transferase
MSIRPKIAQRADFARIRYAQCWEDADVLLEAMNVRPSDTCLSIASAGDNALALVGAGAKRVVAVDLSPAQIACLELRVAAIRRLTHAQFLELLGQNPSADRCTLYLRCRDALSEESREFWDRNPVLIDQGIAQGGKFERYLSAFRRFVLPLVHRQQTVTTLFELESEEERRSFYEQRWNNKRWDLLCRIFFGRASLGRLGRDPSFMKYADEPVWESLQRRIPNAFVVQCPTDNPYLQWILEGRFVSALPYAWRAENFAKIRDNIDALEWRCDSIEQVLAELPDGSLNGCNLSDIFEYMSQADYERLLNEFVRAGAPGCRLVYWNVVTERKSPATFRHAIRPQQALANTLHQRDKAFFYRDFVVEEVL